jgi:hypothetical protein
MKRKKNEFDAFCVFWNFVSLPACLSCSCRSVLLHDSIHLDYRPKYRARFDVLEVHHKQKDEVGGFLPFSVCVNEGLKMKNTFEVDTDELAGQLFPQEHFSQFPTSASCSEGELDSSGVEEGLREILAARDIQVEFEGERAILTFDDWTLVEDIFA